MAGEHFFSDCSMSSRGRDFYAILGVPRDADANALKKAYRALAMRWHPDKNPGNVEEAQAKFQEISEAYETLNDPQKREVYDRFGEAGLRRGAGDGGGAAYSYSRAEDVFRAFFGSAFGGFGGFGGFHDMEEMDDGGMAFSFGGFPGYVFTGGRRRPPRPQAPPPAIINVSCSLEQLFEGTQKTMRHTRRRNGAAEEAALMVTIPPGTAHGAQFPLPGEGDHAPGALPQDVIYVVRELSHPRFARVNDDLTITIRVGLKESLCGVNRTIVGIDRASIGVVMKKPFKPGAELILRGHGMARTGGGRGDLRVKFDVVYPDDLDPDVKEVIESILPDFEE
jgi:DnaJ-class molecular chaperone